MNWLINIGGKLAGISKVFEWLDGKKAKISAASLALISLAGIINGAVQVHDLASLLAWAKSLPASPDTAHLIEALGIWGIRHAIAKQTPAQ